jgi:hypothetical protein
MIFFNHTLMLLVLVLNVNVVCFAFSIKVSNNVSVSEYWYISTHFQSLHKLLQLQLNTWNDFVSDEILSKAESKISICHFPLFFSFMLILRTSFIFRKMHLLLLWIAWFIKLQIKLVACKSDIWTPCIVWNYHRWETIMKILQMTFLQEWTHSFISSSK